MLCDTLWQINVWHVGNQLWLLHILRLRQNGHRFAYIFMCTFFNESLHILIQIQIMLAGSGLAPNRRQANNLLHQWWQSLLVHICLTRGQSIDHTHTHHIHLYFCSYVITWSNKRAPWLVKFLYYIQDIVLIGRVKATTNRIADIEIAILTISSALRDIKITMSTYEELGLWSSFLSHHDQKCIGR